MVAFSLSEIARIMIDDQEENPIPLLEHEDFHAAHPLQHPGTRFCRMIALTMRATPTRGFDLQTGGVTVGVDYRVCPFFAVGLLTGYAHTHADLGQQRQPRC
jgi:Autotransporter beta-domain